MNPVQAAFSAHPRDEMKRVSNCSPSRGAFPRTKGMRAAADIR
jgi:hypothetical protein